MAKDTQSEIQKIQERTKAKIRQIKSQHDKKIIEKDGFLRAIRDYLIISEKQEAKREIREIIRKNDEEEEKEIKKLEEEKEQIR